MFTLAVNHRLPWFPATAHLRVCAESQMVRLPMFVPNLGQEKVSGPTTSPPRPRVSVAAALAVRAARPVGRGA